MDNLGLAGKETASNLARQIRSQIGFVDAISSLRTASRSTQFNATCQATNSSGAGRRPQKKGKEEAAWGEESGLENSRREAIFCAAIMNRSRSLPGASFFVASSLLIAGFRRGLLILFLILAMFPRGGEASTNQLRVDLTELPLEALMELEVPTVYGASKFEQKATEAPSSITVVTSEEIKRYGYRTLGAVLGSVPGLHVSYDRSHAFLGFRGLNLGDFNSRVLVLINGHRVNDNLTDGAYLGTGFILDVDLIDRVEIIRGPGSVLYGNNAFFGVVNVITRDGKQLGGGELSGAYGSYDTYSGRFTFGQSFTNGLQFLLSGTLYDSAGPERLYYREFDTPDQNNGVAVNKDGDSFGSVFGSVSFRGFELQGGHINRQKENPTAQFNTIFNDSRLRTTDERSYANLKYTHSFPEVVDVSARVHYDRAGFLIGYPMSVAVATNLYKEKQTGEWWGAELQLQKRLWENRVTLTLGAEYRDDFRQDLKVYDQNTGLLFTDVHRSRQSHGVFFEGEVSPLSWLRFNHGVRYDQYGDFDFALNPRLALICNPLEKSTFKALYGTAFRAPNFLELSDPENQDIEPEEITAYELVYEQEITRWLRSSLSGYYNQMNELIVFENGGYTNFDADTKGMELALTGFWTNRLQGRVSYSFQQTEDRSGDRDLPDSPAHLVKLNLSSPLVQDKVFASLEFQYTSSRATLYTTPAGQTLAGPDAGDYGIVNVTLFSRNLVKNLECSASIYNLLDNKYSDPSSRFHRQYAIEQDGRTFHLKMTYRF
jgi:iron complex outermembrane receptor protein